MHQYSSDTGKFHSVAPWMNKEEPQYWEEELQDAKFYQTEFRNHVREGMGCFNQTEGFHSAQMMYGCELQDDGSTAGYCLFAYDGRDVIYLDMQNGKYIPTVQEARLIIKEWNSPELNWGEIMKNYLESECIDQVNKSVQYGKEDVERKVRPEVKVWGHLQSEEVIRLHCLVCGFHPRAVDVKWMRNGVDHIPSDEMSPILPHPDGTYQIRVSVEVPAGEEESFSCYVEHSSLGDEPVRVNWQF
ncbi:saoe class I histocompatibility antigen, A alpha chain-like isoform X2 [Pyxicephalus adspersus]|uniref:saoe class I histocompatibility antigen, A alpha chain-like isoform X2 n=1 Tax=Pyxicephalus adspersus TaxID=30357 RepID=UPI003B58FECC